MRRTPPISQNFCINPNNWFIVSLKKQMETDPKHFMSSVLKLFQGKFTTKSFSPSSSMQPVLPAERHLTRPPQLHFIYKYRLRKMYLSCVTSGHTHIQTYKRPPLTLEMYSYHIWVRIFFTSNIICHKQLRPCYRLQICVL